MSLHNQNYSDPAVHDPSQADSSPVIELKGSFLEDGVETLHERLDAAMAEWQESTEFLATHVVRYYETLNVRWNGGVIGQALADRYADQYSVCSARDGVFHRIEGRAPEMLSDFFQDRAAAWAQENETLTFKIAPPLIQGRVAHVSFEMQTMDREEGRHFRQQGHDLFVFNPDGKIHQHLQIFGERKRVHLGGF